MEMPFGLENAGRAAIAPRRLNSGGDDGGPEQCGRLKEDVDVLAGDGNPKWRTVPMLRNRRDGKGRQL